VLITVIVTAAVLVVLLLALSPTHKAAKTPSGKSVPSGQAVFAENLKNDQAQLDRGVLAYTTIGTLSTGARTTFTVLITDIGKHPPATSLPRDYPGWAVDHQDVPTGGIVSVTATCDNVQLKCEPESPARQAVLPASHPGRWYWALTTQSPGTGRLTLTVTTYDQNSQTVLNEAAPIEITVPVHATTAYRLETLAGTVGGLLRWIGPALLIAGAAAIWTRYRKGRRSTTQDTPAHPTPDSVPPTPRAETTNVPPAPPTDRPAPARHSNDPMATKDLTDRNGS